MIHEELFLNWIGQSDMYEQSDQTIQLDNQVNIRLVRLIKLPTHVLSWSGT